ncbi:hypothetical protein HND25_25660 [Rhodococcus erythropolis]|uniref:hypothetical protein n=1 Tax=Rhodococcus erythropolis TaxID=1833 RepID=UPI000767A3A5|nr:hypothetical protein [Rhodococcus erythropolis]MBO8149777.1 hypothetical protein [Rhodococcus erythropolis]MDO1491970.1 hypothetical protein [Rhodococcus erythropolis]GCB56100.1 hypothetical protein rerp_25080 [Rhodococcus erythropolis]
MTRTEMDHDVRAVADAVLYEGYLLYPYRAGSAKNQSRWQFGVLGPPGAAGDGVGEEPSMSAQCLLGELERNGAEVTATVRFLHHQSRTVERLGAGGAWIPVDRLVVDGHEAISWDEATESEIVLGPWGLDELEAGVEESFCAAGVVDGETLADSLGRVVGRVVRTRLPVTGRLELNASAGDRRRVISVSIMNDTSVDMRDKGTATAQSMLGTHVILTCAGSKFVSLFDEPDHSEPLRQNRCYPVLAGTEDPTHPGTSPTVLVSPIILYDFPEIAPQSEGSLFDSTEIDEILTLRILAMTEEEKARARATDSKAADIIDRCESLTADDLAGLHGVLRDSNAGSDLIPEVPDGVDWWTPEADTSVQPRTDAVLINGVRVCGGSTVRLHPSRRADAQDLFFDGRIAHVATIHEDVDGDIHVGVTLLDDPAADLHNWYGRYLYFAPDEIEPVPRDGAS